MLGVATGSSPVGVYDELGRRVAAGELSLAAARAFMLDEYVGLPADHPEAYRNVIQRDFADKVDISPDAVTGPDGRADDLRAACAAYEHEIDGRGRHRSADPGHRHRRARGLQRARLLARLPHADQDPDSPDPGGQRALLRRRARRRAPALPHQGIGTILRARHLLLVATGRHKAEAVHHLVEGPVSAMWPGSALQLHPHVSVVLDTPAASRLQLAGYFKETYAAKPAWQGL